MKKGKGKQYQLPHNTEAVGKEDGNFLEENKGLKNWGWDEYQIERNYNISRNIKTKYWDLDTNQIYQPNQTPLAS